MYQAHDRGLLAEETTHGPRPEDNRDFIVSPQLCDICLLLLCYLIHLHVNPTAARVSVKKHSCNAQLLLGDWGAPSRARTIEPCKRSYCGLACMEAAACTAAAERDADRSEPFLSASTGRALVGGRRTLGVVP